MCNRLSHLQYVFLESCINVSSLNFNLTNWQLGSSLQTWSFDTGESLGVWPWGEFISQLLQEVCLSHFPRNGSALEKPVCSLQSGDVFVSVCRFISSRFSPVTLSHTLAPLILPSPSSFTFMSVSLKDKVSISHPCLFWVPSCSQSAVNSLTCPSKGQIFVTVTWSVPLCQLCNSLWWHVSGCWED